MGVHLEEAQLSLGEAVQATIVLTNTNVLTPTGTLGLFAYSTDQINLGGWEVDLAPGASQRFDYAFVPQSEGSEHLRVSLTDGLTPLWMRDAAYVVGDGASLALNYESLPVYSPGEDVSLSISVANSGNQPADSLLSVQTFNLDAAETTPIVERSHPVSLSTGESEEWLVTVLPATQAAPGRFSVRVHLDGALYRGSEFSVEAEDTLFAEMYPDTIFHEVGDTVTLDVQVRNSVYAFTDATVSASLWDPDGATQSVTMNPIGTGHYQGAVTSPMAGTYLATVDVSKAGYRGTSSRAFFIASEASQLQPTVDGRPIVGATRPVTVTVSNERGTPIVGASVVVSGTTEYLSRQTDAMGQAVLRLSPVVTDTYQVALEKLGFAHTVVDVPVWIASDVWPPVLFLLGVPFITNHTPITVTGLTETGAVLTINDTDIAVDAQGRFSTTLSLSEGDNLLTATAADAMGNSIVVTQTVTLDRIPPPLSLTYPPEGLVTTLEVINVTGSTELGASVMINDTLAPVDPASGAFSAWILLQPGINTIWIAATDAADNVTTVTRTVKVDLGYKVYLPLVVRD